MKALFVLPVKYMLLVTVLICSMQMTNAQKKEQRQEVYVDKNGVMRWQSSNEELHGFGVNYTMPWDPLESTCRHASLSIL